MNNVNLSKGPPRAPEAVFLYVSKLLLPWLMIGSLTQLF